MGVIELGTQSSDGNTLLSRYLYGPLLGYSRVRIGGGSNVLRENRVKAARGWRVIDFHLHRQSTITQAFQNSMSPATNGCCYSIPPDRVSFERKGSIKRQ